MAEIVAEGCPEVRVRTLKSGNKIIIITIAGGDRLEIKATPEDVRVMGMEVMQGGDDLLLERS